MDKRTTTAVESLLSLWNGMEDWRPPSPLSSLGEASPSSSKSYREDACEGDRGREAGEATEIRKPTANVEKVSNRCCLQLTPL